MRGNVGKELRKLGGGGFEGEIAGGARTIPGEVVLGG